jgi:hypothetical protein
MLKFFFSLSLSHRLSREGGSGNSSAVRLRKLGQELFLIEIEIGFSRVIGFMGSSLTGLIQCLSLLF